ncbi:hypothetical protein WJX77_007273 [Trebouxia sp. C0004]
MNQQRQKVKFSTSHQAALLAGLQLLWRYLTALYAHAACFGSRLKFDCQQHWAGFLSSTADPGQAAPGPGYGYKGKLDHILKTEFPHVKSKVYADHAGATLYSKSQIDAFQQDLASHLFGNPHSQHGWSGNEGSAQAVAEARQLTLQMCNAPLGEYECVFTSGATGALKLVAEAFPWQEGSQFEYTQDNHNSVLGIRELALDQGASATCVEMSSAKGSRTKFAAVLQPMYHQSKHISQPATQDSINSLQLPQQAPSSSPSSASPSSAVAHAASRHSRSDAATAPCLFAFPLESNFSGARYDPAVARQVQISGLAVTPCACFKGSEQQCSQQAGLHRSNDDQQQSGQQQAKEEQQYGQQQRQCAEEELQPDQQQQQQQQQSEEGQQSVQQLQAATKEEDHQHPGQHSKEEAPRLRSVDSGRSEGDRWHVLIDAAKACATAPPDLTQNPADFVALSYYKIFGYPTGLGALLVHKRAVPLLMKRKRYFGGGTVAVSLAEEDFFRRREGAAGLEDGTAHYLGIAAVRHGFHQLAALGGFPAIGDHTQSVTRWFAERLVALRHADGASLCVLYGAHHLQPGAQAPGVVGQGPVVTFNLLRHDGSFFGYREVEKLACLHGIFLRTGCFCNPGACARHLGITASQSKRNFEAGHVCWDDNDIIDGRPTGAVRVSFGWMSSLQDAQAILTFLQTCFLNAAGQDPTPGVCTSPRHITSDPSQEVSEKFGQQSLRLDAHCSRAVQHPLQQQLLSAAVPGAASETQAGDSVPSATTSAGALAAFGATASASGNVEMCPDDTEQKPCEQLQDVAKKLPQVTQVTRSRQGSCCLSCICLVEAASMDQGIWVYPIKSCGGSRVSEWPLGPNGLLLDREWALVGDDGSVLTQKGLPRLALIQPRLDLAQGLMQVSMPGMQHDLVISLPLLGCETKAPNQADLVVSVQVRICADNVCSLQEVAPGDRQEEVKVWFQQALGIRCCLVRQQPGSRKPISPSQAPWPGKGCDQDLGGHIGFANEGQFLLMNSASLADMNSRIAAQANKKQTAGGCKGVTVGSVGELSRFRPNLLVGGPSIHAYAEDAWQELQIGTQRFFAAGPCARCEMICMDQTTAVRAGPEPLLTLATYRRQKGRILLGILLGQRNFVLS